MNDPTTPTADCAARAAGAAARPLAEIPTLLVALLAYGGWLAITFAYRLWPLWVVAPVAVVLITLHSSLQHEIVHGHPTRWDWFNRALASLPLSLWLPFERYRQTHRQHHIDARLTDPLDDPETYYWTPERLAELSAVTRTLYWFQQTLAGRMVIGSFWRIAKFLHAELNGVIEDRGNLRIVWLEHLLWCVPVIVWIKLVCGMPLWIYVIAMVIPANGILLIRSFAEHRARPEVRTRVALVEGSWLLGPLFLFNNLHALHHEAPAIPWYQYNARYARERERLIAENGGLVYRTYFEVARRYLFRPHDALRHPSGRVPQGS